MLPRVNRQQVMQKSRVNDHQSWPAIHRGATLALAPCGITMFRSRIARSLFSHAHNLRFGLTRRAGRCLEQAAMVQFRHPPPADPYAEIHHRLHYCQRRRGGDRLTAPAVAAVPLADSSATPSTAIRCCVRRPGLSMAASNAGITKRPLADGGGRRISGQWAAASAFRYVGYRRHRRQGSSTRQRVTNRPAAYSARRRADSISTGLKYRATAPPCCCPDGRRTAGLRSSSRSLMRGNFDRLAAGIPARRTRRWNSSRRRQHFSVW